MMISYENETRFSLENLKKSEFTLAKAEEQWELLLTISVSYTQNMKKKIHNIHLVNRSAFFVH